MCQDKNEQKLNENMAGKMLPNNQLILKVHKYMSENGKLTKIVAQFVLNRNVIIKHGEKCFL